MILETTMIAVVMCFIAKCLWNSSMRCAPHRIEAMDMKLAVDLVEVEVNVPVPVPVTLPVEVVMAI